MGLFSICVHLVHTKQGNRRPLPTRIKGSGTENQTPYTIFHMSTDRQTGMR